MSPPVGATQAAAARSSPGREDSSVIEGSLKTHQAAPGEGKSVHLNMNVSSLSRQSVDLQTVDRLHVSDAAAGGGDALNAHSKGLNSTVGLNSTGVTTAVVLQPSRKDIHKSGQPLAVEAESATFSSAHTPARTPVNTADSTVDHSERQLLQLQQQHGTVQSHPLTQGGPAQISGGGDAVGVLQQNGTVQSRTDLTDHTDHGRQTVSGRPGVDALSKRAQSSCHPTSRNVAAVFSNSVGAPGPDSCGGLEENQSVNERQSDQNLSPVSPLGDAEYDAHLRLSAGQRVQLVQQSLPASPLGPLRGDRHLRLRSRSSMGDAVTAPESEDKSNGLPSPSSGRSADAQSVPVQDRTARYSTVRYSKVPQGVTDSTPESRGSGSDSEESVSGGGGCVDTDRTVPLTSDVSDESEPTCKTSLVPAVGTNGIAGQSVALSHGSRNALGQEVAAEPVAGSSGGQWVTKPRPPACYAEQEVTTAERGQSAATKSVQRVVAGVPRACPELSATVVKEPAAHVKPGDERQTSGGIIPTDLTPSGSIGVDGQPVCGNTTLATTTTSRRELTAAELPKQAEAERLQKRAILEEKSKLLEEQIEEMQRGAEKAAAIAAAVEAAVAATAAAEELRFPKDSLITREGLGLFPPAPATAYHSVITSEGLVLFPPAPGQESPPAYRSRSRSGSFVTAGGSSEAAYRSPGATSESEVAGRVAAEVEERWRAVKLVEESLAAREAALRSAEQAEAQVTRQPVVAAQATGSSMSAEGSMEPEWSSCASSEGDRVIEFGEQLAAQWTVQAQQQQQELAEKVLAAQAESAERHRGEVASVKSEFDQELDRMGRVTREVASSAHKGLVTALEVAAGTDKKVSSLEEVLRSQVSSLQGILDQTLRQQNTMAQRMEGWMQAQSAQQVSMLQQSKLFAEQKAQAASEATQQMLLSVVQSSEEKLQAFQQKIEQQAELVEGRRAAQEAASAEARTEAARQAARLAREQQEAMQQAAARQAEALAQQAAAQQAVAVAQEAAAQEVAAQRAAAQQAAAQQVADQQAAVQQAAAQKAAAQQAAQALTQQQQQAQHGGQHWQQQHQCGGQSQMQGGAGGAGGPPAPRGQVCIICQRSPVDPVSGLCAVCLHQRDGVLGGSPRCSISGCINLAQPGATLCAVHLGGPAQTGPQQQPHQQPQAAAGEDQLAAIFRQNAEQTRELKQMVLTMATQQYTAAQELKKASSKPKDSAKFSTQAQEIWIKLRALFDHAGTNQVRVAPSAVGLTGEELYQEMMVMASDAAVNDSFKYTQSLAYHVTEFLMGGNVNTGAFHPLQLMDFLQRKHMASYRGKRGQQVWTMGRHKSIREEVRGQTYKQVDEGRGAVSI